MNRSMPSEDVMYQALLANDASFEGTFIVAVKTTGIFCRPTCHARKPKRENVEFFASTKEALDHGYRPCRKCVPMSLKGELPAWLKPVFEQLESGLDRKMADSDLRELGLDPNRVRRWFQNVHGMTFQGYQRSLRIGEAFGRIRHGESVTGAALDSGYESLSGFAEGFKKTTGFAPSGSARKAILPTTRILTPLGPMLARSPGSTCC